MDLNTEVRRAGEARQILDSTMFKDALADLDSQMKNLRRAVPIKETEMHTRLIMMEQLYGYLIAYFEQIAVTGKMANIQLEEQSMRQKMMEQGVAMFRKLGRNA